MSDASTKPLIFISYAHADEPEKPADGQVQWLSFVRTFLQPAVKNGIFALWVDRHMTGGAKWQREIEDKLRACDIFILLVSANSMASDYIVDKEIAIIRERQAKGDDVHFYPLLLRPIPKVALDKGRVMNLRPRDAKPFSAYAVNDREQHMTEAANEIAEIAERIVKQKGVVSRAQLPFVHTGTVAQVVLPLLRGQQPVEKIKILFVSANPIGTTQLKLDEEVREIEAKIRAAEHRDSLELITKWAVRPDDLLQSLNQHRPHVVHFSGHGSLTEEIVLLDKLGEPKPVSKEALVSLFRTLKSPFQDLIRDYRAFAA
jgi:hypothetical protein